MITVVRPSFLEKADLYFEWAYATRFAFFSTRGWRAPEPRRVERWAGQDLAPPTTVGLLLEWSSDESAFKALKIADQEQVNVSPFFRGSDNDRESCKARRVWAVSVPIQILKRFLAAVDPFLSRFELAAAVTETRVGSAITSDSQSTSPVLAAVLDDGCAFANSRFQSKGTRVIWLWNQDSDAGGTSLIPSQVPSLQADLGYGRQWSKANLDELYPTPQSSQDVAYRDAGLSGLRRAAAHGTHVADLLAGSEPWDIVFVQFPKLGIDDPTGIWLDRFAIQGLHYVLACAGPATRKIVVNLSWGPQTGPHDGHSIVEDEIDRLVDENNKRQPPRVLIVSLPAGNSFEARAHAEVDVHAGGCVTWMIPPDGSIPAFLEIWWPNGTKVDQVSLIVVPPSEPAVAVAVESTTAGPPLQPLTSNAAWSVQLKEMGGTTQALLVVNPTGGNGTAPRGAHGAWTIQFDPSVSAPTGGAHIYIARAAHNFGARRRAKSSFLTDPALESSRFVTAADRYKGAPNSVIRRDGTLNGLGTGRLSYVAGGYSLKPFECAPYSSSGPSRGAQLQPHFACMTDRSLQVPGVRAAGVRSGTKVTLIGTSTAAPQLGRALANGATGGANPHGLPASRVGAGCIPPDPDLLMPR